MDDDLESHSSEDVLILDDEPVSTDSTVLPETSPCARLCVTAGVFIGLLAIFILAAVWPYERELNSL